MKKIVKRAGLTLALTMGVFYAKASIANQVHSASEVEAHTHQHDSHSVRGATETGTSPQEQAHGEGLHTEIDNEHQQRVVFSPEQLRLGGIEVEVVVPGAYSHQLYAPGEVKANGYTSYLVSPRTDSVVISRHASLGEHVTAGQVLLTLFSEAVAQAQADYLFASTEWQRVKKLGSKTVSESRLVEAQTAFNATYGKLLAFGLTPDAIDKVPSQDTATFGQYSLIAQRAGVVLQDEFLQGQRVNAGETVMLLADEKALWVEARVSPNKTLNLRAGSLALVDFNGEKYQAKVIQEAHTIDPVTRTRVIRLAVDNLGHNLHPGMFVGVYFQMETEHKVMVVPEAALNRNAEGQWTVFVETQTGEFEAVKVNRGQVLGKYRQVMGLPAGARVVTQGAFFVASELNKGGFDPHNH